MVSNLPSALDNLAANGVINFDADAYIQGKPPRYVGEPKLYLPFEQPLCGCPCQCQGARLPQQPSHDAFINNHQEKSEGPADWKKAATAVLIAGLVVLLGVKYKDKIVSLVKKKPAAAPVAPPPVAAAPIATAPVAEAATTAKKSMFKRIGEKIKSMPKWAKITVGVVGGLFALFQTAKAVLIHKAKQANAMAPQAQQGTEFPPVQQAQEAQAAAEPIAEPQPPVSQPPQP